MVDDYAYTEVDFLGDLDMVLPDGEDFDDNLGNFFGYISFLLLCCSVS